MLDAIEVRKVAQDVLFYVWSKHGALSEEPPREPGIILDIPEELVNNLSVSVWIESFRTQYIWDDYFEKHFNCMKSSSESFAQFFAYACYILNESADAHECFFDVLSIASEFSLRCLEKNRLEYLNLCLELFCKFFETELMPNFVEQGGWEKFNEYVLKHYNSIQYKAMDSDGKLPFIRFEYFSEALERSYRPDLVRGIVLKKRKRPYYVVNDIVLKDITQKQVKTDTKSISFAQSIGKNKLKILIQNSFDCLIEDFNRTYKQVKTLYEPVETPSNGTESEDETWVKSGRKKKKLKQQSSKENQRYPAKREEKKINKYGPKSEREDFLHNVNESPVTIQNKKIKQKIDHGSSGGSKKREKSSSQKTEKPLDRIQGKGVQCKADLESSDGLKRQTEHSIQNVKEYSAVLKGKKIKQIDQESSDGLKNQEKHISQKTGKPLDRMQGKTDRESSDGLKRQTKHSMQNVKESPVTIQSKGIKQIIDQESSGGWKKQGRRSSKKTKKPLDRLEGQRAQRKTDRESPVEPKKHTKHSMQNVKESPVTIQNKGIKQKIDQESSEGWKMQKKRASKKTEKPLDRMKDKGAPCKTGQESSNGMKWQEKLSHLQKVQDPSGTLGSKEEQRKMDQEFSSKMENPMDYSSLHGEASKIPFHNTHVFEKLEVKTIKGQDSFKINSFDAGNLQIPVAPAQGLHNKLKSTKIELLGRISVNLERLSKLIKYLFDYHRVQIPAQFQPSNIE